MIQGPTHRRRQPREACLQKIVRGPAFQALYRLFFAQCSRHENKWCVGLFLTYQSQGLESVIVRERIIGQDQIKCSTCESFFELFLGLGKHDVANETLFLERNSNQFCVIRIVLQMQYAQLSFHGHFGGCTSQGTSIAAVAGCVARRTWRPEVGRVKVRHRAPYKVEYGRVVPMAARE